MAATRRVSVGNHRVAVDPSWANTPIEKVWYDGKEVSARMSVFGASHQFEVVEDGIIVAYEVDIGATSDFIFPRPYVTVRRNGKIVFSDK